MKTNRTLSILLFSFLIPLVLDAQIPNANFHTTEHQYDDFSGQVKRIEIRNTDAKGDYHCPIMSNSNQDLIYDTDGKLIERISYDCAEYSYPGYSDSLKITARWGYKYKNGKLKEVFKYDFYQDTLTRRWSYKVVDNSTMIKYMSIENQDTVPIRRFVERGDKLLTYNLENKQDYLKSEEQFDKESRTISFKKFAKNGTPIFLIIYAHDIDTDSLGRAVSYYNSITLLTQEIEKTITKANEQGDIVEKILSTEKGEFKAETFYKYEYDERGNWTKKTTRWRTDKEDDFIEHITTREIEYY